MQENITFSAVKKITYSDDKASANIMRPKALDDVQEGRPTSRRAKLRTSLTALPDGSKPARLPAGWNDEEFLLARKLFFDKLPVPQIAVRLCKTEAQVQHVCNCNGWTAARKAIKQERLLAEAATVKRGKLGDQALPPGHSLTWSLISGGMDWPR